MDVICYGMYDGQEVAKSLESENALEDTYMRTCT